MIWTIPCLMVALLEVAYLGDTSWDDRLVPQELKLKVDLAEIEAFLDNFVYPMSFSSHLWVAHLD